MHKQAELYKRDVRNSSIIIRGNRVFSDATVGRPKAEEKFSYPHGTFAVIPLITELIRMFFKEFCVVEG